MKRRRGLDGVTSNIDSRLSDGDRSRALKVEAAVDLVDEAKSEARRRGGDNFVVVDSDDEADKVIRQRSSMFEDRELGQERSVRPNALVVDPSRPGGWGWALEPNAVEAIEVEGRFCPNCLQAQKNPGSIRCEWRFPLKEAEVRGCGFNWLVDSVIRED